jgi:5-methylcytosine-specific restriction endonuclease McrA
MLDLVDSKVSGNKNLESFKALVLNADAQPLTTFPLSLWAWRESIEAVYKDRVTVLEEWDDAVIRSPRMEFAVPKVVMCKQYIPVSKKCRVPLSRMTLALRDRFCCGYCGQRFPMRELTFDHVIPRSKGGKNTADNLLMACVKCNTMKGNHPITPNGKKGVVRPGNFTPLRMPKQPTFDELYKIGIEFIPDELRDIYGDWLPKSKKILEEERVAMEKDNWGDSKAYWTVELEDD